MDAINDSRCEADDASMSSDAPSTVIDLGSEVADVKDPDSVYIDLTSDDEDYRPAQKEDESKIDSDSEESDDEPGEPAELPSKRSAAKRRLSLPVFSTHRRFIVFTILVNLAVLVASIFPPLSWHSAPAALSLAMSINLTIAVLIRQPRFINLFFRMTRIAKFRLPLSFRWLIAKVYHFGGIHSGAAVSAMFWLIYLTVSVTRQRITAPPDLPHVPSISLLVLTYVLDLQIVVIIILALPFFRSKYHNAFEISHRFLGWASIAVFWAHSVVLTRDVVWNPTDSSLSYAYFTSAAPYLLIAVTLSVASPWITLRKLPVQVTKPSDHAIIVTFPSLPLHTPFPGSTSSISLTPLREFHSFADIPSDDDGATTRLIISRAGDWTSRVIDNPPSHFWIRSIPTAGAAYVGTLFRNVLYVATGSGIGPILPHLKKQHTPVSLFWSCRSPDKTYGHELTTEVRKAVDNQDSDKTVLKIWDTATSGKPDMVAWTWTLKEQCDAEAVVIISNQKLTRKVVYGMEARGVPAFGAIWDS